MAVDAVRQLPRVEFAPRRVEEEFPIPIGRIVSLGSFNHAADPAHFLFGTLFLHDDRADGKYVAFGRHRLGCGCVDVDLDRLKGMWACPFLVSRIQVERIGAKVDKGCTG